MTSEVDERLAITLNDELCSRCSICSAVCPYEAIKLDNESGKIVLDIETCKLCGICYATCPAGAISTPYYDLDALVAYTEQARVLHDTATLVVMCRASAPPLKEVSEIFGISKFIPLYLPCMGRTPVELFLKALASGMEKIFIMACKDDFCGFEKGGVTTKRKISLLQRLVEQFGYDPEVITFRQNSLIAEINILRCTGCLLCEEVCPFEAIEPQTMRDGRIVAAVSESKCRGCGLCVAACRPGALNLQGFSNQRKILAEVTAPWL